MQEVFEKIKERLETELNLANEDRERYLHGNSKQYEFGKAVGHGNGIAVALEIVNQEAEEYNQSLTNINQSLTNDGWIPVSEPPKKDGFYVVTFDGELCGEDAPFVGMCEFEGGDWLEDCVLAWKEQTPYKQEGE